jgi:hypothetical protein
MVFIVGVITFGQVIAGIVLTVGIITMGGIIDTEEVMYYTIMIDVIVQLILTIELE